MKRLLFLSAALSCLTLFGTAGVALATPAPPGPGNSTAAHACQNGGWQNLVTSAGATFTSQDDCVAYAAQGGVLAPKPTATLVMTLSPDSGQPGYCYLLVSGTGLVPNSYPTYTVDGVSSFTSPNAVAADGTYSLNDYYLLSPGVSLFITGTRAADGTTITSNTVTC